MEKRYGSPKRQDGIYKVGRNKYDLFYGFGKDNDDDETGYNYYKRYDHRPTLEEIKNDIISTIEAEYADKLLKGFMWNEKPVEYTEERKTDFTGILVAMQGGLMELPIELNLGSYPDGSPVFHTFDNAEDIAVVAKGIVEHKSATAKAEWAEKASIDWTEYETIK